jgi:hypothetical protein
MSNSNAGNDPPNAEPFTRFAGDREATAKHLKPFTHSGKPIPDGKLPAAAVVACHHNHAAAAFLDLYHELPCPCVTQSVGNCLLRAAQNGIGAGRVENGKIVW